jgi:hypothetical protein
LQEDSVKPIVRAIGFTSVFVLCVFAGVALYIAMASYPHWQRFGVLIISPLVGEMAVNALGGKTRAMLLMPKRVRSKSEND